MRPPCFDLSPPPQFNFEEPPSLHPLYLQQLWESLGYHENEFRTSYLSFKNMADRTAGPSSRFYNTDGALEHLVDDNDSDIEQLSPETETESSSEELY